MDSIKGLFKQIQENHKKLRACKRHNFGKFERKPGAISNNVAVCKNCGGGMKMGDVLEYVRGYEAGGGNSEDIIQGFK